MYIYTFHIKQIKHAYCIIIIIITVLYCIVKQIVHSFKHIELTSDLYIDGMNETL